MKVIDVAATPTGAVFSGRANSICRWANANIPGDAQVVMTTAPAAGGQPGIFCNLVCGDTIWVTQICVGVLTASDTCLFEVGWTDAIDATGTFSPITPARNFVTGAAQDGPQDRMDTLSPALGPLRYSDGVRSITFRVDANDANCQINAAWHGFIINKV